jgi:hypothetical protein
VCALQSLLLVPNWKEQLDVSVALVGLSLWLLCHLLEARPVPRITSQAFTYVFQLLTQREGGTPKRQGPKHSYPSHHM